MEEFRFIRKLRLTNYLINKGFMFKETRVDYKHPDRIVWCFEKTQALQNAIEEYYNLIPIKE